MLVFNTFYIYMQIYLEYIDLYGNIYFMYTIYFYKQAKLPNKLFILFLKTPILIKKLIF